MFRALVERGGVVGLALDAWMMIPGWQRGVTTPESSGLLLEKLVEHLDHFCQLAGNARHVGIGSDLDGCFGTEQTPQDLDTIADLPKLTGLLAGRGYSEEDIEGVMHGNFLRRLRSAWGATDDSPLR
jgi:membrane dipeptidase